MGNPNQSLTKICKSCGQQKPLSAFLELTSIQGAVYGNICAACRKANRDKPVISKEYEESTTSATGVKIDSKTKVQGEIDKRELRKQIEEDYFEERDKQSERQIQHTQKVISTSQNEKKHRSFLDSRILPQKTKTRDASPVFGGEAQKAEAAKLDFTAPVDYARVGGEKLKSTVYKAFTSWIGKGAPISKAIERTVKQNNPSPEKPEMTPLNEYVNKKTR